MDKKEQVKNLYNRFINYTKTAEQHEFTALILMEARISAGYKDLMKNWNENHADIYIRSVGNIFKRLGA